MKTQRFILRKDMPSVRRHVINLINELELEDDIVAQTAVAKAWGI